MRIRGLLLKVGLPVSLIAALAIVLVVRARHPRPDRPLPHPPAADVSTADNLRRQADCYAQARSLYTSLGYPKGRIAGFGNHYNHSLRACFLEVTNLETAGTEVLRLHDYVFDVDARVEFAAYAALVRGKDLMPGAAPERCEVRFPSNERRTCRSEAEFAELINVYMEEE